MNVNNKSLVIKIVTPIVILAVGFLALKYFQNNKPAAERVAGNESAAAGISVEYGFIQPTEFQTTLFAFGEVEAVTRSEIVSQVSGEIVAVSNNSAGGSIFSKGDVLLAIDDKDYTIALASSKADLASAESNLLQEQARSEQAIIDWKRLGNDEQPNALVLRKPQLLSAKAAMESAMAGVERATLNIERTQITAPFDGQVIDRNVNVGQFVNAGHGLLEIYATDKAEVALPLNSQQLALINTNSPEQHGVTFSVDYGLQSYQWEAKIVRTAAAFEQSSRQLTVVASIENPFITTNDRPALRIGQFIQAEIKGRAFENVYVVPIQSVYQNDHIYALEEDVVRKKAVTVIYQDNSFAIIANDTFLDNVIITPLGSTQVGKKVGSKVVKEITVNNNDAITKAINKETQEPAL